MKKILSVLFAVAMALTMTACNGNDGSMLGPDNGMQTKISYDHGVLSVTNAYRTDAYHRGYLYNLLFVDEVVEKISDSEFTRFACEGGWKLSGNYDFWRYEVDYSGGADVQIPNSGMKSGDKIACYFRTPYAQAYWLDPSKAVCVSGCEIIREIPGCGRNCGISGEYVILLK